MGKVDYSCPLPEKSLIQRFKPVFKRLESKQSATLLALPYTGRTSNIRYILGNNTLLNKLGFKTKNKVVSLIDIDKTSGTYESFVTEIIESLTQKLIPIDIFKDTYLLNKELFRLITELTKTQEVVLIVTLNHKSIPFSADIDRLLVQAQKSIANLPLTILWSIDTEVYRKHIKSHPSSTFGQNLFYFPTFNQLETIHNIKRILLAKSINKFKELSNSLEMTGGIAGLFHSYVNTNNQDLFRQDLVQEILKSLRNEMEVNKQLINKLATNSAKELVIKQSNNSTSYKSIRLLSSPTAQEINLLNHFLKNEESPIERDEIAKVIWGKSWNTKYSDWAIDKTISRLRKKIISKEIKILTVKNLGYQLIKLS